MTTAIRSSICLAIAGCIILMQACAPNVVRQPAAAIQPAQTLRQFKLSEAAEVSIGTGYSVKLKSGSTWRLLGNIPQGDVYKPLDQILTLEGSDVHEAYIVVSEGSLTGFYLPVEKSFAPATKKVPLTTNSQ